ncbi:hypothetical protein E7T06_19765 [Deinococcus sp. Arct2-2]|uniref:hypothetical protein n=1 Tax=Deinococcus sp. Arct2-2 TaxID=2568653 RepID=UPI0010A5331B|nr:hypothetical protein [Deinococcus sp. Arct2-2]THF67737.1 hypothetical protein E7T06_19765 [Deinococcus sp. Arct2-2]
MRVRWQVKSKKPVSSPTKGSASDLEYDLGASRAPPPSVTTEERDHSSSLMWSAAHRWATASPDHPHHTEGVRRVQEGRAQDLGWQREHVGWAVLVGRIKAEG